MESFERKVSRAFAQNEDEGTTASLDHFGSDKSHEVNNMQLLKSRVGKDYMKIFSWTPPYGRCA